MPLITPSSGADVQLEDDEAYVGTLTGVELSTGKKFNSDEPQKQVLFKLQVGEDPDAEKWLYCNLSLGRAGNNVATLVKVLNAFAGAPETTAIAGFSTTAAEGYKPFEWRYPDGSSFVLEPGMALTFRGTNYIKNNGNPGYRFDKFKPAPRIAAPAPRQAAAELPPPPAPDADDIPF